MRKRTLMAKAQGFTIIVGIVGAGVGYLYAKEVGAVLGFVIGLFVGNYLDKRR